MHGEMRRGDRRDGDALGAAAIADLAGRGGAEYRRVADDAVDAAQHLDRIVARRHIDDDRREGVAGDRGERGGRRRRPGLVGGVGGAGAAAHFDIRHGIGRRKRVVHVDQIHARQECRTDQYYLNRREKIVASATFVRRSDRGAGPAGNLTTRSSSMMLRGFLFRPAPRLSRTWIARPGMPVGLHRAGEDRTAGPKPTS